MKTYKEFVDLILKQLNQLKEDETDVVHVDWLINQMTDFIKTNQSIVDSPKNYINNPSNTLQIIALQMIPLCVELSDHTLEQKVKESYRLAELFLNLENEK